MTKNIAPVTEDVLKKLDWIVIVDHSGSMAEPSSRFSGKTRLQEVQEDCVSVARTAEKYDDDGITLIAFSGQVRVFDGVKADAVSNVFKEVSPRGSTNLAGALEAAVKKAEASAKEVVVLAYTDGAPDDTKAVQQVLENAGQKLGRPKIGFTFIQVGSDGGATAFLKSLDDGLKVDVVSTVPAGESENLEVAQLVALARSA